MSNLKLQSEVIAGAAPGPRLLITGGVHGDEFEPMAAVRSLIRQIDRRGLRGSVTLVPVVNESAYFRGDRVGEDGLDLARVCPGKPDGSLTERVAFALSTLIRAADFYIDLHTGGTTLCALPLAGYALVRDAAILETQRRMARAFNLPIIWGTTATLDGRSLSVARDAKVPGIYCEYGGGGQCDLCGVTAYVEGCLNVMGELGMIERPVPNSQVRTVVEDDRPGAGHMQLCHPSPMTGFFDPAVSLGGRVEAGEPIGAVSDVLGTDVRRVAAAQSGLVLVLKTFRRVNQGDALAVILETDRTPGGAP